MTFEEQLVLMIIPVVSGILASKWITNSYQKNKEKSDLKRTILSEFTESYTKKYTLTRIFSKFVIEQYASIKDDKITYFETFPEKDDEKPSKKYYEEWKKFSKDFHEISFSSNILVRSMNFYYNDEQLSGKISELSDKLYDAYELTRLFFESDDLTEFHERYKKVDQKLCEVLEMTGNIEYILITTKIK